MADLNNIVDSLSSLTVMEAADLAKLLEEKWGVSAAAPLAMAAGPAAEAAVEEKIQALIGSIDLSRKRMARLEEVIYVRYRTSKIEAIRIEIIGLKERLQVLLDALYAKDELRARTDGIVSRINPNRIKRGDEVCRACVIAWFKKKAVLIPLTATPVGILLGGLEDAPASDMVP